MPDQQEHDREPAPVPHTHRVRLEVLREPGPRERPHRNGDAGPAAEQQYCSPLDPRPADHEPHADRDQRHEGPSPRVGQQQPDHERVDEHHTGDAQPARVLAPRGEPERQGQAEVQQERERVPVPDRRAEPRDPPRAAPRRHRLPEQPPAEHDRDEPGEHVRPPLDRSRRVDADPEPDEREREVDEPAVEVRPRAVGLDRPQERDPAPADERRQESERPERLAREHGFVPTE